MNFVAPYVGAWIETNGLNLIGRGAASHPTWVRGLKHVRTWSNIIYVTSHPTWVRGLKHWHGTAEHTRIDVAPYVGAWIETFGIAQRNRKARSHPTWVRGLKPPNKVIETSDGPSHPTWVRGLKQTADYRATSE